MDIQSLHSNNANKIYQSPNPIKLPSLIQSLDKKVWLIWQEVFSDGWKILIKDILSPGSIPPFKISLKEGGTWSPNISSGVFNQGNYLVWNQHFGKKWQIFASYYDGNQWLEPFKISEDEESNCWQPSLGSLDIQKSFVCWQQRSGSSSKIFGRFIHSGKVAGPPICLSWNHESISWNPQVSTNLNQTLAICWNHWDGNGILTSLLNSKGELLWKSRILDDDSPGISLYPSMVISDEEIISLYWRRENSMSSNLWNASFSLEEFNSQGSPIGQKGDSQFFPRVCLLSDQSKFCAWINESDQDGMDSISIKAQHLSDNGDLIQELNLYESTDSIAELYIEGVCRSKVLLSFKLEKDFDLSTQILLDLNNYSFKIIKVHGKANPNHFSSSSIKEDLIYFSLLEKHQGNSVLNIWNKSI